MITYLIIAAILLAAELLYFRVADHFNIIDKPNQRSSHTRIVLRGGGIIFTIGLWVWSAFYGFQYPWLLAAVTLAAGISFIDDIHSLPDSVRLVVQFLAMGLMLYQLTIGHGDLLPAWWAWALFIVAGLIVCVGATNIYNFMCWFSAFSTLGRRTRPSALPGMSVALESLSSCSSSSANLL